MGKPQNNSGGSYATNTIFNILKIQKVPESWNENELIKSELKWTKYIFQKYEDKKSSVQKKSKM